MLKRSNRPHQSVEEYPTGARHATETISGCADVGTVPLDSHSASNSKEDYGKSDYDSASSLGSPQHLLLEKETNEEQNQSSSLRSALDFAATFFGMRVTSPTELTPLEVVVTPDPASNEFEAAPTLPDIFAVPRSAPIRIASGENGRARDTDYAINTNNTNCSSILRRSNSDCIQPTSFTDAKDGHRWTTKYCILEAGVLYFYGHQNEAESPEAIEERQSVFEGNNNNSTANSNMNLSQSPIPTRLLTSVGGNPSHVWEKRVALDGVRAVRSAENEYGSNAFELKAVDEDDSDNLVLRAPSSEEMNDWIFQFHRSLATFMLNIMEQMNSVRRPSYGDIHYPSFDRRQERLPASLALVPPLTLTTINPPFKKRVIPSSALSHGHGRNSVHRRKAECSKRSDPPEPSSPESSSMPFALQIEDSQNATRRTVTPYIERRPAIPFTSPTSTNSSSILAIDCKDNSSPVRQTPSGAPKYLPPAMRKAQSSVNVPPSPYRDDGSFTIPAKAAYVPPSLRNASKYVPPSARHASAPSLSLAERAAMQPVEVDHDLDDDHSNGDVGMPMDSPDREDEEPNGDIDVTSFKRGGCADPRFINGSILDNEFIPRKVSRLGKITTEPFGYQNRKEGTSSTSALRWEVGAVSECGIREWNEDSYLIASNLQDALNTKGGYETVWRDDENHQAGLFALFDGHLGNHAARFAAEKLPQFIYDESIRSIGDENNGGNPDPKRVEGILRQSLLKLDNEFCKLCSQDGRDWESGATALVAALVNEHLVVANLGDCRGVVGRSHEDIDDISSMEKDGWNALPVVDSGRSRRCLWKQVSEDHSPLRVDEKKRIEDANGWITTVTEISVVQLKRIFLGDEDVVDILKRCFSDRYHSSSKAAAPQRILYLSNVCGELGVSRAIGDRDFKAAFNSPHLNATNEQEWECPLHLIYPVNHSHRFSHDLVSNVPDFQTIRIGGKGISDEFLVLACDGLWDVMDADDAIRVTRDLLFERCWSAKKAAARLAQLAIHLGSSDNITVIVVRFFNREN